MCETRYYMDNGHYWKLDVENDYDFPLNPREDYDCFSHITTWLGGYWQGRGCGDYLGDDCGYKDMYDLMEGLVRDNITEKQIISYVRRGKTRMRVEYDRHERKWSLYSTRLFKSCFWEKGEEYLVADTDSTLDWLIDDMIEELSWSECVGILEEYANMIFLPLNAYDYGCNGYQVKEAWDFDSCDGVAWIDKKSVEECMLTSKNWKGEGLRIIRGELHVYNLYLEGCCYYATWYLYDVSERDFVEDETVGGFLTDKWGDELFKEIAETDHEMFETFEELYRYVS